MAQKTTIKPGAGVGLDKNSKVVVQSAEDCWWADLEPSGVCSGVVFTQTIYNGCSDPYAWKWTYTKQLTGTRGPVRIIKTPLPSTIECGEPFQRINVPAYNPPCPGPPLYKTTEFGTSGCSKCEVRWVSAHGPHESEYVYIENSTPCHTPTPTPKPTPTPNCWSDWEHNPAERKQTEKETCKGKYVDSYKRWTATSTWCEENQPPQTSINSPILGRCVPNWGPEHPKGGWHNTPWPQDVFMTQQDRSKCNCEEKVIAMKCGGLKGKPFAIMDSDPRTPERCKDGLTKWDTLRGDWVKP